MGVGRISFLLLAIACLSGYFPSDATALTTRKGKSVDQVNTEQQANEKTWRDSAGKEHVPILPDDSSLSLRMGKHSDSDPYASPEEKKLTDLVDIVRKFLKLGLDKQCAAVQLTHQYLKKYAHEHKPCLLFCTLCNLSPQVIHYLLSSSDPVGSFSTFDITNPTFGAHDIVKSTDPEMKQKLSTSTFNSIEEVFASRKEDTENMWLTIVRVIIQEKEIPADPRMHHRSVHMFCCVHVGDLGVMFQSYVHAYTMDDWIEATDLGRDKLGHIKGYGGQVISMGDLAKKIDRMIELVKADVSKAFRIYTDLFGSSQHSDFLDERTNRDPNRAYVGYSFASTYRVTSFEDIQKRVAFFEQCEPCRLPSHHQLSQSRQEERAEATD